MSARVCESCNRNSAMYVCRECGKTICESCFSIDDWKCYECSKLMSATRGTHETKGIVSGWPTAFTLFTASFIIVFVGMALMILASLFSGITGSSGVVIFIGPFPIAIGAGPQASLMITVAFALAIVAMILFFLFGRRRIF